MYTNHNHIPENKNEMLYCFKWRPNKFYLASFRDFRQNLKKQKKTKQTNKQTNISQKNFSMNFGS